MNKEKLLKEIVELPKIETNNPIITMNSITVDDLMSVIDRLNKVPDYNDLLKENQELIEKFKATNKGLQKAVLKRKKWKYRYQLARCKIKELERIIELCHLDAKETLATINYEQESQQKEFIKYLEDEINKLKEQIKNYDIWHEVGTDINFLIFKKQFYLEILKKYKEIIGDDK